MRTREICEKFALCKPLRNNRIKQKLAYFLRNLQTSGKLENSQD